MMRIANDEDIANALIFQNVKIHTCTVVHLQF